MSTIERAAARLGTIGKVRAEPIVRDTPPDSTRVDGLPVEALLETHREVPPARVESTVSPRIGGGYCEIDVNALTAAGFATQQNVNVEIAADLRRIKRPLLMAIKKSAALGQQGLPHNLILITSALPGEGKTFVSINLALSISAELDRSVLLVDADVAKNDVARVLGLTYEVGLTDLLDRRNIHTEDAVLQTNIESLSLLPSGRMLPNVDELFASDKMARLMRELAEHDPNRIVIVDAPPLHAGTEASVLARMVGQVVVLVEADKTPQSCVSDALHQLKGCGTVSLVLNKARRRSSDHVAYGYGYGYGSQGS
jgi:exopolysaccharide/PEP-CTERM locus tyrosine autokinase